MNENQPQTLPVYPVQYIPNTQDEISLVDIWLILRKHRKLFLMTVIGVTLMGLVLALLLPKKFNLHTSLAIGTEIKEGTPTLIEAPETVQAKLENSLIPMVKNKLNMEKGESQKYRISVSIPKHSSLIILTSKITKKHEEMYKDLHNKIVNATSQDHSKYTNIVKGNLESSLVMAKIALDKMRDPTTLAALISPQEKIVADAKADLSALNEPEIFGAKIKVMKGEIQRQKDKLASLEDKAVTLHKNLTQKDANQKLITDQIKELEIEIRNASALKSSPGQGVDSESSALARLMLGNEIQENRILLAKLKERLLITLENEKTAIHMSLESNKREQRLQVEKIAEVEADLEAYIATNQLEQNKLKASVSKAEANIATLVNTQKRSIAIEEQAVKEIRLSLDNLMETRAVIEPTLSAEPASTPKRVILLIAMFLGGILGIAVVFFAALREKVADTVTQQ